MQTQPSSLPTRTRGPNGTTSTGPQGRRFTAMGRRSALQATARRTSEETSGLYRTISASTGNEVFTPSKNDRTKAMTIRTATGAGISQARPNANATTRMLGSAQEVSRWISPPSAPDAGWSAARNTIADVVATAKSNRPSLRFTRTRSGCAGVTGRPGHHHACSRCRNAGFEQDPAVSFHSAETTQLVADPLTLLLQFPSRNELRPCSGRACHGYSHNEPATAGSSRDLRSSIANSDLFLTFLAFFIAVPVIVSNAWPRGRAPSR